MPEPPRGIEDNDLGAKVVTVPIAAALKRKGNRVIYFAGYKRPEDLYKRAEIEKACDLIIWSCDVGPAIPVRRPQDRTLVGNIVQAIEAYATGRLGPVTIPLREVDRILTIGSDRMMAAARKAQVRCASETRRKSAPSPSKLQGRPCPTRSIRVSSWR